MEVLGAKQGGQQLQAMMQNMTLAQAQTQVIVAGLSAGGADGPGRAALVEQSWDMINETTV